MPTSSTSLQGIHPLLALASFAPITAAQDCSPFPARVVDVGWGPGEVLPVDVDLDGDLDLLVAQTFDARIAQFRNDGAGGFTRTTDLSFVDGVYSFAAADVDGDQLLDVVAWEFSDFTNVETLTLRRGTGVATTLLTAPAALHSIACPPVLADIDGDGDRDVVVARVPSAPGGARLEFFIDLGAGVYAPGTGLPVPGTNAAVISLVAGDFDGDGDTDLAARVANVGAMTWTQSPGGSWNAPVVTGPAGDVDGRIVAADFDGDGVLDRAVLVGGASALVSTATGSTSIVVGPRARDLAAADADGDGDPDLVVLADEFQVWTNQLGVFTNGPRLAAPPNAERCAAADLNGDGRADFAATSTGNDALALHVGSRSSNYAPAQRIALPQVARIDGADLDSDGDIDLLVEHAGPLADQVLRNDGAAGFTPSAALAGTGPYRVLDVDGDGRLDVLSRGTGAVVLQRGTSTPFVFTTTTIAVPSVIARGYSVGDVDQDGDADLVVAGEDASGVNSRVHVLLQAAGAFGAPVSTPAAIGAGDVELADVDGDGDLDLFVGGIPRLELLRNPGTGSFGAATTLLAPTANVARFALADVDGDGDVDVVAGTLTPYALVVLANDGSGGYTVAQQALLPHAPWDLRVARLDDDGAPDVLVFEQLNVQPYGSCASVWRNRGDGALEFAGRHAPGPLTGALAALDVDADSRTDVLLGVSAFATLPAGLAVLANGGSCATGASLCGGDGSGAACPCNNSGGTGRGCANSREPAGAALAAVGRARVATDTLRLTATGLPPTSIVMMLQGDAASSGGLGTPFGDGLDCLGANVRVLALRAASGGVAELGAGTAQPVSLALLGALPPLGGTRYYQARYRNAASFCTIATFNTTNALRVVWGD